MVALRGVAEVGECVGLEDDVSNGGYVSLIKNIYTYLYICVYI